MHYCFCYFYSDALRLTDNSRLPIPETRNRKPPRFSKSIFDAEWEIRFDKKSQERESFWVLWQHFETQVQTRDQKGQELIHWEVGTRLGSQEIYDHVEAWWRKEIKRARDPGGVPQVSRYVLGKSEHLYDIARVWAILEKFLLGDQLKQRIVSE